MTPPEQSTPEPAPIPVSPRIAHNSKLAADFMLKHPMGRYPKVTGQADRIAFEREKLFPYGYNPSMVEYGDETLMVYRWHDGKTLHSDLAVARIKQGTVVHNQKLELGAGGEDAKIILYNGLPFMTWVESTYPQQPFRSVVRCAHLEEDRIKTVCTPQLKGNDFTTMQKNWVPFMHEARLHLITQCFPSHVVYEMNWDKPQNGYNTPGPRWAYGQIRGGTPPLPWGGEGMIRFFHSGLDNEYGEYHRRYFMGAYIMNSKPPFDVLAVSKKPIIYGSELDNLKKADREACHHHYKRQVVFPGGAVPCLNGWIVAVGINDSAIELLNIHPEQLNL